LALTCEPASPAGVLLVKSLLEERAEEPPPYVMGIAREHPAKVISGSN
jgi:hypothetical protein